MTQQQHGPSTAMSLQVLLERYADKEEILQLVLTAKIEEDKRHAAEATAVAEQARLARVELEHNLLLRHGTSTGADRLVRTTSDFHPLCSTSATSSAVHRTVHGSPPAMLSDAKLASTLVSEHGQLHATTATFTDTLASSPTDMTQMPSLPIISHGRSNSSGSSHELSLHRSATLPGNLKTTNMPLPGHNTVTDITGDLKPLTEEQVGVLVKKRNHAEAMRAVRERILKRRANSLSGAMRSVSTSSLPVMSSSQRAHDRLSIPQPIVLGGSSAATHANGPTTTTAVPSMAASSATTITYFEHSQHRSLM